MKVNPNSEVTYLVDRNINYTNVCTINCQFCSFYRPPGHDETYTQEINEISDRVTELEQIGGSRILMQGIGVNPSLGMSYYLNLLKQLREKHPSIDLDCFSPIEIEGIAEVTSLSTLQVLEEFQRAGMHGLPGGGAEMLVDGVRMDISPKKGHPDNWLRVMEEAQSLGLITSATNVFGFGESLEDRIEHMRRIRELQASNFKIIRLVLPLLSHGRFNWKRIRMVNGIKGVIGLNWVQEPLNIYVTSPLQDSTFTISFTFRHHGRPWVLMSRRWRYLLGLMT